MKKSGCYWLCHHSVLIEWVWDEDERRDYIDLLKPKHERAVRQHCFQPVKGKLPHGFVKAHKTWFKASKTRKKTYETWHKANETWHKANETWHKATERWEK